MKFYTSDGCAYEGLTETTIIALRSDLGKSTTFVDKATYDAYVAVHRLGV